jgi:hypothetical protein
MTSQLSWSALILAAIAALACFSPGEPPVCRETRPIYGGHACCERHRLVGPVAAHYEAVEAARRASVGDPDRP